MYVPVKCFTLADYMFQQIPGQFHKCTLIYVCIRGGTSMCIIPERVVFCIRSGHSYAQSESSKTIGMACLTCPNKNRRLFESRGTGNICHSRFARSGCQSVMATSVGVQYPCTWPSMKYAYGSGARPWCVKGVHVDPLDWGNGR